MNRESKGGIVAPDVLWAEEPAGGHDELNAFKDRVEAEGCLEFSF
jgi:hypothetical protein